MTSDNAELEQSRYSWLQAAQAAEKRVEVLEGLLRNLRNVFPHSAWPILEKVDAALSASAKPCCTPTAEELKLLADGDYTPEELWGVGGKPSCPDCHRVNPVERDDQAEFKRVHMRLFGCDPRLDDQQSDFSLSHYNRWRVWQARAALDKSTEGASHE